MSAAPVGYHLMLRLRGPKGLDQIEDLIRDEYVLGRGDPTKSMDFAIPDDEYLSRVHLRLIRAGETYAVENLSENGTRLNGKLITKPMPLKHKDRIEAGTETSLEFLAMTDQERSDALKGAGPATAKPVEKVKKSKQPLFLAMIAFYGLIGLVVVMAANQSEPPSIPDPGNGAFLAWMKRMPLQPRPTEDEWKRAEQQWWAKKEEGEKDISPAQRARISARAKEDATLRARRVLAENDKVTESDRIWSEAKARFGNSPDRGAADYYLIQGAIEALAVRGRDSLQAAAEAGDPPALAAIGAPPKNKGDPPDANAAMSRLEKRLAALKLDALRFRNSGQRKYERERYGQILDAVPDVYQPIRQWAEWRLFGGTGTR
jgi:hypothetical protein